MQGARRDDAVHIDLAQRASRLPPRLPVTSWSGHLPFLYVLMGLLRPRIVVELGVQYGASFVGACDAARRDHLPCRLYGIDTWEGDAHAGYYDAEAVLGDLPDYIRTHFPNAELIRSTFEAARPRFDPDTVDLLHIDGLHSYEAVRADVDSWLPTLSERGVLLLHDTAVRERGFGVWRLWEELQPRFATFEFFHGFGLGVAFVGGSPPPPLADFIERLRGNPDFAGLVRALCEEMGNSLPRRFYERSQGEAYPAWEAFRTESLGEIGRLKAENEALKRSVAIFETLAGEIERQRQG